MEFVLLVIAAGVVFYLVKTLKEYLNNPIRPLETDSRAQQTREITQKEEEVILSPKDKLKNTEYGILTRMLGRLSYADHESCILEEKLVEGMIEDMSRDSMAPKSLFMEIYKESKNEDMVELALLFRDETIGQYKKRLKVVEFAFALAYADGNFSEEEEQLIVDIAANLEIENEDFNQLYDEFKSKNDGEAELVDRKKALEIVGLSSEFDQKELNKKIDDLFQQKRQNILDHKNLNRPYNQSSAKDLKEISQAYELLSKEMDPKEESKNKEDQSKS